MSHKGTILLTPLFKEDETRTASQHRVFSDRARGNF